jgi:hypothetical protein
MAQQEIYFPFFATMEYTWGQKEGERERTKHEKNNILKTTVELKCEIELGVGVGGVVEKGRKRGK